MKSKKIWANLASSDLDRTTRFYTELGFTSNGNSEDLTSFFFGEENFIIHFFSVQRFETFANNKTADLSNQTEVIFSLSASGREEVDEWYIKVKQSGGRIFSEPQDYGKGYSFGFADPDGHKFNFLYWPGM